MPLMTRNIDHFSATTINSYIPEYGR